MGFVVSSLPDYVERNRDRIVKAMVLGGKTLDRINVQTGIKHTGAINILNVDPTLQAASCNPSAAGNTTFTQRTISVAHIGYYLTFCKEDILGKWTEYQVRLAARKEDNPLPFEDFIVEQLLEKANRDTEKLIWLGDTTATTDAVRKQGDGLIKLASNDTNTVKVSLADGVDAYTAIKSVILAIPAAVLEKACVFVSPDTFLKFAQTLVERNFYHFGVEGTPDEIVFPGTGVKVVKTAGLAGSTSILAADPANLYFGCDLENDAERFDLVYDAFAGYKLAMTWGAGVNYAISEEVVVATISTVSAGIVAGDGTQAALASIAESAATLAGAVDEDGNFQVEQVTPNASDATQG